VNTIDNQQVTSKNTKLTGKKPAKLISSHSYLATATAKPFSSRNFTRRLQQKKIPACKSKQGQKI
jgi:hypothetical protein